EAGPDEWHLRVFDSGGQRYYLLQDAAPYGYLEHLINAFAAVVISICVLGAFLIGRRVASHVIAPITQLADAVQSGRKPFPCQDAGDEIGVLARAFARHSDELERFLHREQCFSGDASHELRTPLAIIGGAAETLACQLPSDSHLVPSAERILRTTQEMQRQLSCLLLLSRTPGSVPRNKVALRPLIESCMERCQPWISGKPVIVAFDARHDAVLDTNADLAHSVIWNLLRNACQYTERGEVRITLHDTALTVADTGPGLPSSIDPQQFQRFVPGSPHNGEGLGLSIVQRIVEHLGWRMTVHSSQQGCRFSLEWPA
ncbi:MAG: HAMP domain-containing sensor histidine kinase, partial [Pseudomonadota bacterium]